MRKYLLLILFTNLLLADEFEVSKEVKGVNQKNYTDTTTIEIKNEKKEIPTGKVEVVELGPKKADIKEKEKVSIVTTPREEVEITPIDDEVNVKEKTERYSKVFFGVGGHDKVTNYNYGLIDISRIEKYDVNYDLFIKRETAEENRENSKKSSDLIDASFQKDKVKIDLALEKGTQEFPGMNTSLTQVKTDKEYTDLATGVTYKIKDDMSIELDYSYKNNNSDTILTGPEGVYTRDYKYSTYGIKGTKDFLYSDDYGNHSIDSTIGFVRETSSSDDSRNVIFVEASDRFNLVKIENTAFIGKLRVEGGNKTNLSFQTEATRKLDSNVAINAGLGLKSSHTLKKDVINNFYYVNDIVDFENLDNEKIYTLSGGMTFVKEKLYVEAKALINAGDDLITYEAKEVSTGLERAIKPTNYEKSVMWLEAKLNVGYTLTENVRGIANLGLSTLDDIAYSPTLKASVEGIYTRKSYETGLKYNFNGSMYTQNKGASDRGAIGSYGTFDWSNTYSFGDDYLVSFGVNNLLDVKGNKMKDYNINGRMASIGVQIKY